MLSAADGFAPDGLNRRVWRGLAVLTLACILAGCRAAGSISPEGSDAFQRGYIDGCWSGWGVAAKPGFEAVYYKDEARYTSDADYHTGWEQGQLECYTQQMNFPTMGAAK
jgi:hypothetical protein